MTEDHFYTESLEAFQNDLAAAGFEPVAVAGLSGWRGPIRRAFVGLTDATTMDVVIRPGWPFQSPALLVDGLNTNHSTPGGFVCLWQDGDPSGDWETVEGFFGRVDEWCENAKRGWDGDDLEGDAFLNFTRKVSTVATFNLSELGIRSGDGAELRGRVSRDPPRVEIVPGRPNLPNQLRGLGFDVGSLNTPPPRQLSEVFRCLSRKQSGRLKRALDDRRRPEPFVASGGLDLILLCWERHGRPDLLVMACQGMNKDTEAIALQPGPTDESSLILRAGPDAPELRAMTATLFGAGALGGHIAVALAASGLGCLNIVDGDVLLPGNVVRHVAEHDQVGRSKVQAVHRIISGHAPWTEVAEFQESPMTPGQIRERISNTDIVVDATGNDAFAPALAMVAKEDGVPLVSGAIYRGGNVARVQRQILESDTPVHQRKEGAQYTVIPQGDVREEFAAPALGCSAPVNNAPPSSVMACVSLIVQVALDALTGRFEFDDEVIDVYRSIPEAPFDKIGRLT